MDTILSQRVQKVKPSPTLAVAAKAAELKAQGKDIIGLGTGEPDFDTPEHIKQAAVEAIEQGFTKYTPVDGIVELKQAVIDKFARDNALDYSLPQILVSCGGKQSIFNLAQAMLQAGDEVIIPAPYWVSYPDIVLLAEATPVIIQTTIENGFKINAEQLEKSISEKTRLVFLNSPSNPSGKAYSAEELAALAEVLLKHPKVMVATDDMYEHILWTDSPFVNILNVCPELYQRCVVLNGVSKAYAMTGWRIGYAAGPAKLIAAMKKIQSQSTSNPCGISQKAAVAALNGDHAPVKAMVSEFKRRHQKVYQALNNMPGVRVTPADGTFYIFPDVSEWIQAKGLENDVALAARLLEEVGIALVPGSAFGTEGCIRLSFACSDTVLNSALERLEQFSEYS